MDSKKRLKSCSKWKNNNKKQENKNKKTRNKKDKIMQTGRDEGGNLYGE